MFTFYEFIAGDVSAHKFICLLISMQSKPFHFTIEVCITQCTKRGARGLDLVWLWPPFLPQSLKCLILGTFLFFFLIVFLCSDLWTFTPHLFQLTQK